jgi:hypothetical protein
MELIRENFEAAIHHGLELEVIVEALIAMKFNPDLDPEEAFAKGCHEWDVHMLQLDNDINNLDQNG